MRIAFAIPILLLIVIPGYAPSDAADISPSVNADRNEAGWAELDAQARITDGDYDGAVQAERHADADRREADRQEMLARSRKQ